jgi:hypothetical protein
MVRPRLLSREAQGGPLVPPFDLVDADDRRVELAPQAHREHLYRLETRGASIRGGIKLLDR